MKRLKQMFSISFESDSAVENEAFRKFLHIFTEMGSTIGAFLIIAALTLISGLDILYVILPIYLFQLALVEAIKFTFNKPRPNLEVHRNMLGLKMTSGSFPSGHTSNIFSLAFLISNYYQFNIFFILIAFIVAGGIAFSRVLLGRHFTIDIAAGAICGLTFSVIGALLLPHLLNIIL